ncbi:hypothetical protein [Geobacter benzoatilyticus]|uniref:Uncharacterized protein n=1 Tax=Geobacter benzoatilyticus TaxID=2815309 RepID=A0ABX7Q7X0_9BACT|nr:hypothetical protein [Geobacter benzoatilyticus]QSV47070.1 hypothetical protein JZM60_07370 [Geobacter benzoatilyticus]
MITLCNGPSVVALFMPRSEEEIDNQQKWRSGKSSFKVADKELPGPEDYQRQDKDNQKYGHKFVHGS